VSKGWLKIFLIVLIKPTIFAMNVRSNLIEVKMPKPVALDLGWIQWQGKVHEKLRIIQNDKEKSVKSSGILQNYKEKSVKSSGMCQIDKKKSVKISGILQIESKLLVQGYWIYFTKVSVTYYCEPKSQIKSCWLFHEFFKQCTALITATTLMFST
jgi:hypothetical protein